jgi:hypothetical protein
MSKGDSPSGHVRGKFGYRKNLIIRLCPLSCESPGTDFSKTFRRSLLQLGIPVISGFLDSSDLSSFSPTRCLEGKKSQNHEGRIWVVTLVWFLPSTARLPSFLSDKALREWARRTRSRWKHHPHTPTWGQETEHIWSRLTKSRNFRSRQKTVGVIVGALAA